MSSDAERWAIAVLRARGADALQHAAERIESFMLVGDDIAMLRWWDIYQRLEQLTAVARRRH